MTIIRPGAPLLLDPACGLPLDEPFTATTAREAGLTRHGLTGLVTAGLVRQPLKGVYLAVQAGDSTRLRCECLRLVLPPDCVVVDRHAAWLLGAPMALAPNEHRELRPIQVFRLRGNTRLRCSLADSGERELRPEDITEVNGIPVTTPLRTAWDLGRTRFPEPALAGIDAMLRLGVDKDELLDGIGWFARRRWVTTLRAVAPLGDGRAESPPESILRLRWIQAGLPEPEPQLIVVVDGVQIARLDLGNRDLRAGAEYDGAEWHTSPLQQAHDRARRADVADDAWLLEVMTAPNLFGPRQDAEQRLRALGHEARRRLHARPVVL